LQAQSTLINLEF